MNAKAIMMVLSEKIRSNEMKIVDQMAIPEKKTKEMAKAIKSLDLKGKTLIAYSKEEMDLRLASRNISKIENTTVQQLNVWDMLNNKNLLLSKNSVKYLQDKYSKKE